MFLGKSTPSTVLLLVDSADAVDKIEAGRRYCEFSITTALGDDLIELTDLGDTGIAKLGTPSLFIIINSFY